MSAEGDDHTLVEAKAKAKALVSFTFNPPAKLEVCIFSRSRDIRGVPKFEK